MVAFNDIERRRLAEGQLREREAALTEQQAALREVATSLPGRRPRPTYSLRSPGRWAGVPDAPGSDVSLRARWDGDGDAAWSERPHPFQAGTRWPLEGPTISMLVRDTGRPARLDDLGGVPGRLAEAVRGPGWLVAGAPIVVGGRVWGVIATGAAEDQRLPADIEHRLAEFTELVASAIANAQAREDVQRLAEEQAALATRGDGRRVGSATRRTSSALVAQEIARVTGLELIVMGRYDPGRMMTRSVPPANIRSSRAPAGRSMVRERVFAGPRHRTTGQAATRTTRWPGRSPRQRGRPASRRASARR